MYFICQRDIYISFVKDRREREQRDADRRAKEDREWEREQARRQSDMREKEEQERSAARREREEWDERRRKEEQDGETSRLERLESVYGENRSRRWQRSPPRWRNPSPLRIRGQPFTREQREQQRQVQHCSDTLCNLL